MTDYHVDPAGNDSNDGLSPATAWKTWTKAAATAYPVNSKVLLKAGMQVAGPLAVPTTNPTIDIYGGSTKVTFSGLGDIKGTTSDWAQEATNPNAWTRTLPVPVFRSRDWVIFNGKATLQGKVSTPIQVNAPGKFCRATDATATVYAIGNPASVYDTLENIVVDQSGLQFRVAGGLVRNCIFRGFRSGYTLNKDDLTVEDCEVWFTTNAGLLLQANNCNVWRSPSYYTGSTSGGHGIYVTRARPSPDAPVTMVNYVYDSPNYASAEDNFQQNVNGSDDIPEDKIETHLIATSPKSMWLWRSGGENAIDVKRGLLILEGPGMASGPANSQATATTQAASRGIINRGWSLRHAGNAAAIQMQEQNYNKFDSEKSFYYSESNVSFFSIYNGQAHTSAWDVFWSPKNIAAAFNTGGLSATHSTFIGSFGAVQAQAQVLSAAMIASITNDGIDDGSGNYTATLAETNIIGSLFGAGARIKIAGLTGESAAYNGVHTLTAVGLYKGKTKFPVSIASNPPPTAVLTGLILTRLGVLGPFRNNLLVGSTRPLNIGTLDNLPVALGANCISEFGTGTNRLAFLGPRDYTAAQVISDADVVNNLKFDSGGKAGGSAWKAEENNTGINSTIVFEAGTISVTSGVATVTTPLAPMVGQGVGITGSTNPNLHGAQFVKSVGPGFFTFDANYDEPDAPEKPCAVTQWRVKSSSVAYRSAT